MHSSFNSITLLILLLGIILPFIIYHHFKKRLDKETNSIDSTFKEFTVEGETFLLTASTPDQKYALTLNTSNDLEVWYIKTKTRKKKLITHTFHILAIAISPDGKRAVSAMDCTVQDYMQEHQHDCSETLHFWEIDKKNPLIDKADHSSYISTISFSPCGNHILAGGGCYWETSSSRNCSENLTYWDVKEAELTHILSLHKGIISAITFRPQGNYAISVSQELLSCWERDEEEDAWDLIASIPIQYNAIKEIIFNKYGDKLIINSEEIVQSIDFQDLLSNPEKFSFTKS